MNVLALDLGTTTGWATLVAGVESSGAWELATEKELYRQRKIKSEKPYPQRGDRLTDLRVARLFDHLNQILPALRIDWVFFEDVKFCKTQAQAQLWASLRTAVWLAVKRVYAVRIDCLAIQNLKQFATGKGNATKEEMIAALGRVEISHDEADALHLLHFARQKLGI